MLLRSVRASRRLLSAEARPTKTGFKAVKYLESKNEFLASIGTEVGGKEPEKPGSCLEIPKTDTADVQSLALAQMMSAGMHFGHSKATLAPNYRQYVLGIRHGIVIIDLDKTLACLRRAAQVAYEISRLGGIILIVGTRPHYSPMVERVARSIGVFFIATEWKNGLLSNAKRLLKQATDMDAVIFTPPVAGSSLGPLAQKQLLEGGVLSAESRRDESSVKSPSHVSLPDLVIVLDGPTNKKAFEECNLVMIPTIGIIDSNFDASLCTYPIPANDDSIASVDFTLSMLASAIKDGRQLTSRQNWRPTHTPR